jgi:hypothetical protein
MARKRSPKGRDDTLSGVARNNGQEHFRIRPEVLAATLLLLFAILSVYSYTRTSATYDEPLHLAHGFNALGSGDFRLDPGHPPLARILAALPLLAETVTGVDSATIDRANPVEWAPVQQNSLAHRFLYVDNDADRLLYRARFMSVLLGIVLGGLIFLWARECLGPAPALAAVAFFAIEPNLMAHFSLVTTDASLACFVFGAVYFLWRTCRSAGAGNIAGFVVFFVLAILTKFSALLLAPLVVFLLGYAVFRRRSLTLARALIILAVLAASTWGGIWAAYGFRYAPGSAASWTLRYKADPRVGAAAPLVSGIVTWVDERRLLPNAFSQGLLITQALAQSRNAYLAGDYSKTGWWSFFPIAIGIKTPIALLILSIAALALWRVKKREDEDAAVFVAAPIALFLGFAMVSKINIGLRHVLMIYPFLIVMAAFTLREALALRADRGRVAVAVLAAFWIFEFGRVYPHQLAFFNTFVGGPDRGAEYLIDSNLDWGQDLKGLRAWMVGNKVDELSLAYFGTADPRYYNIQSIYLPGSPPFIPVELQRAPKLPGYVAVSATLMSGAYVDERRRDFYKPLLALNPVASIGHSISVYWVESRWW